MMVKVCGITRREDAIVAVEAGASAIGFIFYPKSPRYVTPEKARELGEGIDAWKVGVFVDEPAAHIEEVMRAANLDVAQVYGENIPGGARVWRAYRMQPGYGAFNAAGAEAVFFDGQKNGEQFDWFDVRNSYPKVVIAGGLDASNVAEAIRICHPWGVDASSGLESSPGIKDHEKVRQFVKAAREAA
jgi:phosphoribosylanthranilate isomerase